MRVTRSAFDEQGEDVISTVTVLPHQTARLDVGVYESTMSPPKLCLVYEPDVREYIGAAVLRLNGDGEYTLLYQVENFGDVACTVGVRECDGDTGMA